MIDGRSVKSRGVASLFEQIELKKFVKFYLILIFSLEIVIFLFCFLSQLEPIGIPFPWRYYFLASFLMPIAITFLLGVFVAAFNTFFFGAQNGGLESQETGAREAAEDGPQLSGRLGKMTASLHFLKQAPFLLSLLVLGVIVIVFSHIDHFFVLMANLGEKAIRFSLIGLGILAAIGIVFGIVWVIGRYKMERLRFEYDYKREVMAQLGVIITEHNAVIDSEGKIIALPEKTRSRKKKQGLPSEPNPLMLTQSKGS